MVCGSNLEKHHPQNDGGQVSLPGEVGATGNSQRARSEKAGGTKEGVHPSSPHQPSETYIRLMPLGRGDPGAGVKTEAESSQKRDPPLEQGGLARAQRDGVGRLPPAPVRPSRGAPSPARPAPRRAPAECLVTVRLRRPRAPPSFPGPAHGPHPRGAHFRMHGPAGPDSEREHGARLAAGGAHLPRLRATSGPGRPRPLPRHGVQAGAAAFVPAARRRRCGLLRLPGDRRRLGRVGQRAPGGRAGRPGRRGGEPQAGRHLREYPLAPGAPLHAWVPAARVPPPRFVSASLCRNSLCSCLVRPPPASPRMGPQRCAVRFPTRVGVRIPAGFDERSVKGLFRGPRSCACVCSSAGIIITLAGVGEI